ncbi:MAG TPA: helix-turn-helix domain-containing protein [Streptosporangiaceae bacterium]|nr:helix-turn-helix domain-containing protein [Streptosporangiaceae bacterium]
MKIAARLAAEPTWLTAGEAARAAGVSAGHMRRLIRRGAIEADRGDGRTYAVNTDSLAAWLGQRREERGPVRCPVDRVRDDMARQVERRHPGWTVSHSIYGWTAVKPGFRPVRSSSWNGFASGLEWRERDARELQEQEQSVQQVVDRLRAGLVFSPDGWDAFVGGIRDGEIG